jgi:hypothetical protein
VVRILNAGARLIVASQLHAPVGKQEVGKQENSALNIVTREILFACGVKGSQQTILGDMGGSTEKFFLLSCKTPKKGRAIPYV